MSWTLSDHPHRVFARNPIVAVVTQLRFDPILKVREYVPEFQDAIRQSFPKFEEREAEFLDVSPAGVRVQKATEFVFRSRDDVATVVLGTNAVGLDYRIHRQRSDLLRHAALAYGKAIELLKCSPTRLGLRYTNVIDRERINTDLGTELTWGDLIAPAFLNPPSGLADLDGTRFAVEVASVLEPGHMTARYGLLPRLDPKRLVFQLDIDRYRDDTFAQSDVESCLVRFADDIFRVFRQASGPGLERWMTEDS